MVIFVILMYSLYLIRHAKSSWANPGLKDSMRPLNKRGKRDAPLMGKILMKLQEIPDLMISSPARRAYFTAEIIAKEIGISTGDIAVNNNLYMADKDEFMDIIKKTENNISKLMLISHNSGITDFANYISNAEIENIPTCGIVKIDFEIDSWKNISKGTGKLMLFEYPRKYRDGI